MQLMACLYPEKPRDKGVPEEAKRNHASLGENPPEANKGSSLKSGQDFAVKRKLIPMT